MLGIIGRLVKRREHLFVLSRETHAFLVPLLFCDNAKMGAEV